MPFPVTLNIYDVTGEPVIQKVNAVLRPIGTGAFHGAVEVHGKEWSYGFTEEGSGIFDCEPRSCDQHHFRESMPLGETNLSQEEVMKVIEQLDTEWPGPDYDLLRKNCCVFSAEFAQRIGAGPFPKWVLNLGAAGATIADGALQAANKTQALAIIAAAKAGKVDEKYNIRGTAQAKAQDFLKAVKGVDKKYRIKEAAIGAVGKMTAKAQELDSKYSITQQATALGSQAAEKARQADQAISQRLQNSARGGAPTMDGPQEPKSSGKSGCMQC